MEIDLSTCANRGNTIHSHKNIGETKCGFQNLIDSKPNSGSAGEVFARMQQARMAFTNFRHLRHQLDLRLSIISQIYILAMRLVLLDGSEIRPLRGEYVGGILVCKHRYFLSNGEMRWKNCLSKSDVAGNLLGSGTQSSEWIPRMSELWWLGHV